MGISFTMKVDLTDPDNFFAKPREQAVAEVMAEIDRIPDLFRCSRCGTNYNITGYEEREGVCCGIPLDVPEG